MEHRDRSPTTKGPVEWFTGDVWVDTVAQGHGAAPTTVRLVHFFSRKEQHVYQGPRHNWP